MSITLTTPYSVGGPNVAPETDPYVAVMGIAADQVKQTLTLTVYPVISQTLNAGKVTGVTPGTIDPITVVVNCVTGAWYSSSGQGGVLTGASLTGAQGWLASALTSVMKNQAETAWISMGIFPGVQVAWQ